MIAGPPGSNPLCIVNAGVHGLTIITADGKSLEVPPKHGVDVVQFTRELDWPLDGVSRGAFKSATLVTPDELRERYGG
jgi:hypothetical protein